ncbi:MAG TPA: sulfatase [Pseudonocardia sp.]
MVLTVLAALLVFVALLAPNEFDRFTVGAFLRIPVELLVAAALFLVLPATARRVVALLAGLVLALLTILTLLDISFFGTLDRPFDPVFDWSLLEDAAGFVRDSLGRSGEIAAEVAVVLLAVAVLVLLPLSVLRVSRVVARHRKASARAVAGLAAVWLFCAVFDARLVPGLPLAAANTASLAYGRVEQVDAGLNDRTAFAAQLRSDAFQNTPGDQLLPALRGKDVVLAFVESYGRSAVQDPRIAPKVDALLADGDRRLAAAGYSSRSAFLTSPTYGGGSWLAHSTLLSGLWIDNQQRFTALEASNRLTLTRAFARASWRTVGIMPGVTEPWPEAPFYGYDKVYASWDLGYHGPPFSWATMPDQYTLLAFQRAERQEPQRPSLMAQIVLVSSHAPWSPLPHPVGWADVGDGSIYNGEATGNALPRAILGRDPTRVRNDYRDSIEYSLNSLISYVETFGDDRLVLVFLGDHQPASVVTGQHANRDVPITIVARDRSVLDRISGWGWQEGLKPGPQAPVWRMDAFRDRFLTAFGSTPGPARTPYPPNR